MATQSFTTEQINAMREWCVECAIDSEDMEARQEASDSAIIRWVSRNYAGGLAEFLRLHDEDNA